MPLAVKEEENSVDTDFCSNSPDHPPDIKPDLAMLLHPKEEEMNNVNTASSSDAQDDPADIKPDLELLADVKEETVNKAIATFSSDALDDPPDIKPDLAILLHPKEEEMNNVDTASSSDTQDDPANMKPDLEMLADVKEETVNKAVATTSSDAQGGELLAILRRLAAEKARTTKRDFFVLRHTCTTAVRSLLVKEQKKKFESLLKDACRIRDGNLAVEAESVTIFIRKNRTRIDLCTLIVKVHVRRELNTD